MPVRPSPREFSPALRQEFLEAAVRGPLDLVVMGGGISGAATARDAALRGLRVALLERADFASGASGRSSKLIHGGLDALRTLRVRRVFDAVRERAKFLELAPERVRPTAFLYPAYREHRTRAWQVHLALGAYDVLQLDPGREWHRLLDPAGMIELEPALRPEGLEGGNLYRDAVTDDLLLTLDTVRSAAQAGALPIPHAEVLRVEASPSGLQTVGIRDHLSGRELELAAPVVVNATGPWGDQNRTRLVGNGRAPLPLLRLVRGTHLALDRRRLPSAHALVLTSPRDERLVCTLPWGDIVLVGSASTAYEGDPEQVRATRHDVDYLLETLDFHLPHLRLGPQDVVGTSAGVRPLVRSGSRTRSGYRVLEERPGLLTVAGGSLTNARRLAREVVERAVEGLGPRRGLGKPGACATGLVPLRDGAGFGAADPEAARYARESGLDPAGVRSLRMRHPGGWIDVLRLLASEPALSAALPPGAGPGSGHVQGEVIHAVRYQMTLTLGDLACRRLGLDLRAADRAEEALAAAAGLMARELGWDEAERDRQLALAGAELARARAWKAGP